ncbi:hypothetical protein CB1_000069016 [Camelus ferus]|nr:hypothetical protein CB1_000069016 [Camelus ferus]
MLIRARAASPAGPSQPTVPCGLGPGSAPYPVGALWGKPHEAPVGQSEITRLCRAALQARTVDVSSVLPPRTRSVWGRSRGGREDVEDQSSFLRRPWTEDAALHSEVYEDEDYRKVRFVGRQKEVNENFAIDLIAEQPVSEVGSRVISCDGGGGALAPWATREST